MSDQVGAQVRSQGGPGANAALTPNWAGDIVTFVPCDPPLKISPTTPFTGRVSDVAISSTPMAIIAQHVPTPGCSVAEVLRGKAQLPESAERQVAESAQMFLCGTWTSPQQHSGSGHHPGECFAWRW